MMQKPHPLRSPLIWFLASLAGIVIAASCNLDGPDDIAFAADQSAQLTTLQTAAPGSAAQHAAAQALCRQERGPGAKALWLDDGALVCRAAPVAVAQRGAL